MSTTTYSGGLVHADVRAGKSAEEVRRAIDACAPPGDERRRALAVNEAVKTRWGDETPLLGAHRMGRGDLVGLLLEDGADAGEVCTVGDHRMTALALCAHHDLPETLRVLLRKGHDPSQRVVLVDEIFLLFLT